VNTNDYIFASATRDQAIEYIHIDAQSFGGEAQEKLDEFEGHGQRSIDQTGVVLHAGRVVAGGYVLPTGQFFGGRRIASAAVAGVAVLPEHRGRGAGRALMVGHLHACREQRIPLSVLYAATPTFYRKVGYEPAGWIVRWKVDPDDLAAARPDGCTYVRADKDDPTIRELYARWAVEHNGPLTRSDEFWMRNLDPPKNRRHIYRLEFDATAEGYVALCHERPDHACRVEDMVTRSPRAACAAMALLYQHRSINREIRWAGSFHDPWRKRIDENAAHIDHTEEWLLRLCDVEAALSQRGYPAIHCELHLDVRDDVIPDNAGRYVLSVRGGAPTVQRGGSGRIALDVRSLAAIFTGHCTPQAMRDVGLLEGPSEDLATMQLAFAGEPPFMTDQF